MTTTQLVYRYILLLTCICITPVTLSAAERTGNKRQAWVIISDTSDPLLKTSRIYSGRKFIVTPTSKRTVSQPIAISKNNTISVVQVSAKSKPVKTLLKIPVPKTINQALIVLTPLVDEDGESSISSTVVDLANFKKGDWLFLNLTESDIRVSEDSKPLEIAAGASVVSKATLKKPKSVPLSYDYRDKDAEEWTALSASTIIRNPQRKEICIFTWDSSFKRFDYYGVTFPQSQK